MKIVVAPDSYKGSLTAVEVTDAMVGGVLDIFPNALIEKVPIADGGEGTVAALTKATGGVQRQLRVTGPLGSPVDAVWGVLGDGVTAVIEMAAASGLTLVHRNDLNPLAATSFGTGELIKAALDAGLRRFIIGIGGSATNDGGAGMASALGVRFVDTSGRVLPAGGAALACLDHIDLSELDARLSDCSIDVACDVHNPLCGPQGASVVYGPQKGASVQDVVVLDKALSHFAQVAYRDVGRDILRTPGAGAAGGVGAGLLLFTPAVLRKGIDIVIEATNLSQTVAGADLVLTGEGRTDEQTAYGKAPIGVADIASQLGVPTLCISGGLSDGYEAIFSQGIAGAASIVNRPMALEECLRDAQSLVQSATRNVCRLVRTGMDMQKGYTERTSRAEVERVSCNPGNTRASQGQPTHEDTNER